MNFLLFILNVFERLKQPDKPVFISLKNKNVFLNYPIYLKYSRWIIIIIASIIPILAMLKSNNAIIILFTSVIFFIVLTKQFNWVKELNEFFQRLYEYDYLILEFIISNELSSEKNGSIESAEFSYEEKDREIIIYAVKNGDRFSNKLESLDTELSALLNLTITEKLIRPSAVEYHFQTVKPRRLHLISTGEKNYINSHEINLGFGVSYNPIACPHILIAGGTGSGKSLFISFFILSLLQKKAEILVCDIKNSDLGALAHYLGGERVATTQNNIARVVRLAVEEMRKRYDYMNDPENFKYGSNFSNHGFKEVWLIFDEMGAFQASGTGTDKQSKAIMSEVMDGIKKVILLGRQSGVFCLISAQQMSANTLSTDLRDNLGLRIALGANSSEGYRMVLGSATPETIPLIEEKGSGLLYMQGSGKETAQYYEAPYMNPKEFDFIAELQLYVNDGSVQAN